VDEVEFGRYRLLSLIGEGGMGNVYKAHDTVIGRDVAIKVLSPELSAQPGYRERFRREAHIAAGLTEPHIIPIHDAGEIEGQLYLVMPVIKGIDVQGLLTRDGPMSPQRAVHVIEQLAAALDAAHAVGLVHRDIKPSNALVTGRDFVYLIDFGIAHDTTATKLTRTGAFLGTFAYMAPERFGTGTTDARADVYALACVLHECLTGAQPFPGDSMEQQIAGHLTLDPPRPSAVRPAVPASFDEVIAAGMAKDPDRRYQTATELADAAHSALTVTSTAAPTQLRPTPFDTPALIDAPTRPKAWDPRPGDQPPHSLVTVPYPGGQHGGDVNLTPPQVPPVWPPGPHPGPADGPPADFDASPQPARRGLKWPLIAALAVLLVAVGIGGYLLRPHSPAPQNPTAQPSDRTAQPVPPAGPPSKPSESSGGPVSVTALAGLLLSPDQINAAMATTGMTAGPTFTSLGDDSSTLSDKACLPVYSPAQAQSYANSGWTALRGQQVADHQSSTQITSFVVQNVVLLPSAHDAGAFFAASAQSWPACANRQYSLNVAGKPSQVFSAGPVSNTGVTLSATSTQDAANGITCLRALTVANNVAIDVVACSFSKFNPTNNPAVNIAHQIAANVPAA
jgi:serine/threonine protein kinase